MWKPSWTWFLFEFKFSIWGLDICLWTEIENTNPDNGWCWCVLQRWTLLQHSQYSGRLNEELKHAVKSFSCLCLYSACKSWKQIFQGGGGWICPSSKTNCKITPMPPFHQAAFGEGHALQRHQVQRTFTFWIRSKGRLEGILRNGRRDAQLNILSFEVLGWKSNWGTKISSEGSGYDTSLWLRTKYRAELRVKSKLSVQPWTRQTTQGSSSSRHSRD